MLLDLRIEIVAARQFASQRALMTRQLEGIDPAHAILSADEQLKSAI